MTKIHHTRHLLAFLFILTSAVFLSPTASAKIDTTNVEPVTDERWVISEFYPGSGDDYDGAYLEIYNNTDRRTIGYKDFVVNLPFDLELPPVYGIHNYRPHGYKKLSLEDGWEGWAVKEYLDVMYGDEYFSEVEDALNQMDGYAYERCQISENKPAISDKFYYGKKSPGKRILCSDKSIQETPDGILGEDDINDHQCKNLRLNEIYTNTDNKQFIEVKNIGDEDINLSHCYLSNSKDENDNMVAFADGEAILAKGEITSADPTMLGLDSLNLTRGIIYLVDSDRQTVVDYRRYATPKKNTALALDDKSEWQITYEPTPDGANVIAGEPCPTGQTRNPETNRCVKNSDKDDNKDDEDNSTNKNKACPAGKYYYEPTGRCRAIPTDDSDDSSSSGSNSSTIQPCREGYERSPETNRCRKITTDSGSNSSSSLTPCASGYERNPDTNRCIKIKTSSGTSSSFSSSGQKTLAPCKDGYERNPATNRCVKKKSAASTNLKACKEGYERSPETNRCRKKTSSSGSSKSNSTNGAKFPVTTKSTNGSGSGTTSTTGLLIILGVVSGISVIILIWQYRAEIGRFYRKLAGEQHVKQR